MITFLFIRNKSTCEYIRLNKQTVQYGSWEQASSETNALKVYVLKK